MSLNLLIILGSCVAGVVFGLLVYWIILRTVKTRRSNQSNFIEVEKQTPLTHTEDIDQPSLIKREAGTQEEDENWLNEGVSEVSASTLHKEDDDWLNAGMEEVPAKDFKQQDEDWLNGEDDRSLEPVKESSSNRATVNPPEIQIQQDGSILNITVTKASKQDKKPEQTVINLKINVSPPDSDRKEKELYEVELTSSYQGLEDAATIKTLEESVTTGNALMDEISVRPVDNPVTESQDSNS
jgi:hypothetical protein